MKSGHQEHLIRVEVIAFTAHTAVFPRLSGMKVMNPAALGASLLPFGHINHFCVLFLSSYYYLLLLPEESRPDPLHSALTLERRWIRTPCCPAALLPDARRSPSQSPRSSHIPPRCSAPCTSERPSDFPFTHRSAFLSCPPPPSHSLLRLYITPASSRQRFINKPCDDAHALFLLDRTQDFLSDAEQNPLRAQWWR